MAEYAREPTSDEQLRNLQDQVRRLWTRIPAAGASAAQVWQPTDAQVNNAGGWYVNATGGSPQPYWMRQGDMVSVGGCWQFYDAGSNALTLMSAGVLPPEFLPSTNILIHALGVGSIHDRIWAIVLATDGLLTLTSMANGTLPGAPGGPLESWGSIVDGDDHAIAVIPQAYPAANLGVV